MTEMLDKLFHEDEEFYTKFVACRGSSAQTCLDLLQDVRARWYCSCDSLIEGSTALGLRLRARTDEEAQALRSFRKALP